MSNTTTQETKPASKTPNYVAYNVIDRGEGKKSKGGKSVWRSTTRRQRYRHPLRCYAPVREDHPPGSGSKRVTGSKRAGLTSPPVSNKQEKHDARNSPNRN